MAKKKKDDDETQDETTSDGSIAVNDAWTGLLAISRLALAVGSGFLLWDYLQYDEPLPTIPKYAPKAPGGVVAKPDGGAEKKVEEKDKDKIKDKDKEKDKDTSLRHTLPDMCAMPPSHAQRHFEIVHFRDRRPGQDVSFENI